MSSQDNLFDDDFGSIYDQITSDPPPIVLNPETEPEPVAAPETKEPVPVVATQEAESSEFGDILDELTTEDPAPQASAATAVLEPQTKSASTAARDDASDFDLDDEEEIFADAACKKCGSDEDWGQARWCPSCGWYPEMGMTVSGGETVEEDEFREINNWWEVLPAWAWVLVIGCVSLVVGSLAVRVMMPGGPATSGLKFWLSIGLLAAGVIAFGVAHFRAYLTAVPKNDKLAPLDLFINPTTVWRDTFANRLPKAAPRVWTGGWGLTAVVCGAVLVGGIRWNAIFEQDWAEAGAKTNLVAAIVDKAKDASDDEDMEDALNSLKGEDDGPLPIEKRPRLDCLIVGYTVDSRDNPEFILLAGLDAGEELGYVGRLSLSDLPEEATERIFDDIEEFQVKRPIVKVPFVGKYLQPKLMCRVHYLTRTTTGRLSTIGFDKMLRDFAVE